MLRLVFVFIVFISAIDADEYDFDMDAIEQKPYEYSGYLRMEDKTKQNHFHLEGLLDFSYNYDIYRFKVSSMVFYDYIDDVISDKDFIVNELYVDAKLTKNHTVLVGKESLKWGKGYFYNPVAFFDRPKDPAQPTQAREGFNIAKYSYNKSFNSSLKNLSFDLVYLPSSKEINEDYHKLITNSKNAINIATRVYLLLYDTDIDIIYNYSDMASDKIGIDFSKNILTNFEVHGEYAKIIDTKYSYLLGVRYLTDFEMTIISEYLYKSGELEKQEIQNTTLITQKEPFSWLYSSIYYKNTLNIQDNSMQNKVGVTYSFKNNINTDFSYNINSKEDFLWLRLTWSF
ncbi:MAG: hypothetical protein U9N02_06700 [Campylobacterota bacterium]|nr:hypothetical protein [Campylobacterota bacterium]